MRNQNDFWFLAEDLDYQLVFKIPQFKLSETVKEEC